MFKALIRHLFVTLLGLSCAVPTLASAQDLFEKTFLYKFSDSSSRSKIVRSVSRGGYELDDGRYQSFRGWYSSDIPDLTLLLYTEANPNFAVIWGISTGEYGEKYRIDPTLHLGFSVTHAFTPHFSITLTAIGALGGRLSEKSCFANYPPFGTYEVNCRLAASELPPAETLDYMMSARGWHESTISIKLDYQF